MCILVCTQIHTDLDASPPTPGCLWLCVCSNTNGEAVFTHNIFLHWRITLYAATDLCYFYRVTPYKVNDNKSLQTIQSHVCCHIFHSYAANTGCTESALGSLHGFICAPPPPEQYSFVQVTHFLYLFTCFSIGDNLKVKLYPGYYINRNSLTLPSLWKTK